MLLDKFTDFQIQVELLTKKNPYKAWLRNKPTLMHTIHIPACRCHPPNKGNEQHTRNLEFQVLIYIYTGRGCTIRIIISLLPSLTLILLH